MWPRPGPEPETAADQEWDHNREQIERAFPRSSRKEAAPLVPTAGVTDRARMARTHPRAYLAATVWLMDQSEDKPAPVVARAPACLRRGWE